MPTPGAAVAMLGPRGAAPVSHDPSRRLPEQGLLELPCTPTIEFLPLECQVCDYSVKLPL